MDPYYSLALHGKRPLESSGSGSKIFWKIIREKEKKCSFCRRMRVFDQELFPDANARVLNLKEEEQAEPWPRQRDSRGLLPCKAKE